MSNFIVDTVSLEQVYPHEEFFCQCHSTNDPYTLIHPRRCIILTGGSFVMQLTYLSLPVGREFDSIRGFKLPGSWTG
jgi:hypothetical protein